MFCLSCPLCSLTLIILPQPLWNDFPFKIIVYEKSIDVACLLLKFGEIFLVQKYFSRTIHFTYKHLHQNKMHLFDYEQVKSRNVSSSVFFFLSLLICFVFVILGIYFYFHFLKQSLYVFLAILELTVYTKLASTSKRLTHL